MIGAGILLVVSSILLIVTAIFFIEREKAKIAIGIFLTLWALPFPFLCLLFSEHERWVLAYFSCCVFIPVFICFLARKRKTTERLFAVLITWVLLGTAIGVVEEVRERKQEERATKRKAEEQLERNALQAQERLIQEARDYLQTTCDKAERIFIKSDIALNEGILISHDRREHALLPLPETAPTESVPAEIIRYRMAHNDENREESIRVLREIQYGYSIPWSGDDMLEETWSALASPTAERQKFFVEVESAAVMDTKEKYLRRASRTFWEQEGSRERVLRDSLKAKTLRDKKVSEADILRDYEATPTWKHFDVPVDTSRATYAFLAEDISTFEDRAHWVARGRLRLVRRDTEEVVAEYIGFSANVAPVVKEASYADSSETSASSKNRYWEATEMCPNTERIFRLDRRQQTPIDGFFQAIKRARGKEVTYFGALPFTDTDKTPSLSRFTRNDDSILIEGTRLSDFLSKDILKSGSVYFDLPTGNRPSMIWRAVQLDRDISLYGASASDNGNATTVGDVLIEGVKGKRFDLLHIAIAGDLIVKDSEFGNNRFLATINAVPHVLFERVRAEMAIHLNSSENGKTKSDARFPRNKSVIFRSCAAPLEAININAEHFRIERSANGHQIILRNGRIGTLEIVGSKIAWLDLGQTEVDRLEIIDSEIERINFGDGRNVQLKISGSKIGELDFNHARVEILEVSSSIIEEIGAREAWVGAVLPSVGNESLRKALYGKQP